MRYITTILFILLATTIAFTQTRRMNTTLHSRSYTLETQNRSTLLLLQEAERKFRALDYDGTFLTLENAVAQAPYSPDALLMRARFRNIVGMQTEAEMDVRLANKINPLAADLYGYYGNKGLLKILSIEPENALTGLTTLQKLNYYYQALDNKMMEDNNEELLIIRLETIVEDIESNYLIEAENSINEILENNQQSAIAYDLKGVVLYKQGNFEDAADAFSKAVTLEPNFAIAWYNFAQTEKSLGHLEKAKRYLDRAIELQEDLAKAYFERALVLKKMGEKEKALIDYNKVIEMKGDSYMEAYLNRGLTKKMLGDYGGALADFNKVIDEFPRNAELRKNRGNLHLLFGLPQKAIEDYSKAIELNSDYAEAYYNRAMAFYLIFDKISGCSDLQNSIDLGYEKAVEAKKYFCTQY